MIDAEGLDDIPGFAWGDFASLGEYFDGTETQTHKKKIYLNLTKWKQRKSWADKIKEV